MVELAPFLLALVIAAVVRHGAARLLLNRQYPAVMLNTRRSKRVNERVAAIDTSRLTSEQVAELRIEAQKEEGVRLRPLGVLLASGLSLWLVSIVVVWIASVQIGGAFATAIWWVPWAYIAVKVIFALPSTLEKLADQSVISAGCGALMVLLLVVPILLVYTFAPVGVITFVIIYWCVSWALWRIFPYQNADLPKVAMLFL